MSGRVSRRTFRPAANSRAMELSIRMCEPRLMRTVGPRMSQAWRAGSTSETEGTGSRIGPQGVTFDSM
jgi:hypothetical protein